MATHRHLNNIALIGFMGAGKSTVGHLLAELLGFGFIDTDKLIEQRAGRRISDIFAHEGEPAFRALEKSLVAELASLKQKVISTGGGMVVDPQNLESLRSHCLVACLWASPETIYDRVRTQTHRPLLQTENPLEKIRALLAERTPCYRQADLMVGVDFRHAADVARHIAKSFQDAAKRQGNPPHTPAPFPTPVAAPLPTPPPSPALAQPPLPTP